MVFALYRHWMTPVVAVAAVGFGAAFGSWGPNPSLRALMIWASFRTEYAV